MSSVKYSSYFQLIGLSVLSNSMHAVLCNHVQRWIILCTELVVEKFAIFRTTEGIFFYDFFFLNLFLTSPFNVSNDLIFQSFQIGTYCSENLTRNATEVTTGKNLVFNFQNYAINLEILCNFIFYIYFINFITTKIRHMLHFLHILSSCENLKSSLLTYWTIMTFRMKMSKSKSLTFVPLTKIPVNRINIWKANRNEGLSHQANSVQHLPAPLPVTKWQIFTSLHHDAAKILLTINENESFQTRHYAARSMLEWTGYAFSIIKKRYRNLNGYYGSVCVKN